MDPIDLAGVAFWALVVSVSLIVKFRWPRALYRLLSLRSSRQEKAAIDAALRLGLNIRTEGAIVTIYGRVDGQSITLKEWPHASEGRYRRTLRVSPPGGVPYGLQVSREGVVTGIKKRFIGQDIQAGDPPFDSRLLISGSDEPGVVSLLNSGTRRLMEELIAAGGWIIDKDGLLYSFDAIESAEHLESLFRKAASLSMRLARTRSIEERLIENLRCEQQATVRLRSLEMLARLPCSPEIQAAIEKAARDNIWQVSVPAAELLDERGLQQLSAASVSAPPRLAIRALRALKKEWGPAALDTVRGALAHPKDEVAAEAALLLGTWRDSESARALIELAAGGRSASIRSAAMTALAHLRAREATPALVAALSEADPDVKVAAARALAYCGSVDDIPELLDFATNTTDARLRSAARQSIAAIQAGLISAERGWVSVADQTAVDGALSVENEAATGSLSVTKGGHE